MTWSTRARYSHFIFSLNSNWRAQSSRLRESAVAQTMKVHMGESHGGAPLEGPHRRVPEKARLTGRSPLEGPHLRVPLGVLLKGPTGGEADMLQRGAGGEGPDSLRGSCPEAAGDAGPHSSCGNRAAPGSAGAGWAAGVVWWSRRVPGDRKGKTCCGGPSCERSHCSRSSSPPCLGPPHRTVCCLARPSPSSSSHTCPVVPCFCVTWTSSWSITWVHVFASLAWLQIMPLKLLLLAAYARMNP